MDIIKKKAQVLDTKILVNVKELKKEYVVYLINNQDIIYIGKTGEYAKYIVEKADRYIFTHYAIEEFLGNSIDDYVAELILNIQPINNKSVPKNNKYISITQCKNKYGIYASKFKKIWNEVGKQLEINKIKYIETQIVQDYTGIFKEYHKDMPKRNSRIILIKDKKDIVGDGWGVIVKTLYNDEGEAVRAMVDEEIDWNEAYKNYIHNQKHYLYVNQIIDSEIFEATNKEFTKKYMLNAKDKDSVWTEGKEYISLEHIVEKMEKQNYRGK